MRSRCFRPLRPRNLTGSSVVGRLLVLGLAVLLVGSHAALAGDDALSRVRARDGFASLLLRYGMSESSTFRGLVEELDASAVIVYVEVRQEAGHAMGGQLRLITETQGVRWVRVVVDTGTTHLNTAQQRLVQLTAILGHELQHAREVAQASVILDDEGFARLFRTIGIELHPNRFDTAAARAVGPLIETEIRGVGVVAIKARLVMLGQATSLIAPVAPAHLGARISSGIPAQGRRAAHRRDRR